MMDSDLPPLQAGVAATLPEEISTAEALLAALEQEQTSLTTGLNTGHTGQIAVLLETKAMHVAQLSTLAASRHQKLAMQGLSASEAGMQDWLAHAPGQVQAQWQTLISIVRQANEINRVNGLLLAQQLVRNRQHLQALGMRGASQTFYGPDGQLGQGGVKRASVQG